MKFSSNVYLVGPMGAGKTTIGRLLASELGLTFKDTDKEIEEATGADIPWIFDVEGEDGFRQREAKIVDKLTQQTSTLLATGGGVVLREENRRHLAARGMVVYLQASVAQQVSRTAKDRNRPLLQNDDPEAVLSALMEARDPLYREIADLIVTTDQRHPRSVVTEICDRLQSLS